MKKFITITSIIAAGILMTACSSNTNKTSSLDTEVFSYAATVSFAEYLALVQNGGGIEIDEKAVAQAIEDALAGEPKMDPTNAQATVDEFLNITLPAYRMYAANQFVEKAGKQKGTVTTDSGLVYKIIKKGDNTRANEESVVTTSYISKKSNGETIVEVNQPETVVLTSYINGVIEGLQQIGKGGKIQLWIPSQLAFGSNGNENLKVYGNEAIYMEIELLDIK